MNTGTFGVAPYDAGVASATLNVGQQLGGSIGTALLNTIATSATASYLVGLHLSPASLASPARPAGARGGGRARIHDRVLVDGRDLRRRGHRLRSLLRRGPLYRQAEAQVAVPAGQPQSGPSVPA